MYAFINAKKELSDLKVCQLFVFEQLNFVVTVISYLLTSIRPSDHFSLFLLLKLYTNLFLKSRSKAHEIFGLFFQHKRTMRINIIILTNLLLYIRTSVLMQTNCLPVIVIALSFAEYRFFNFFT